MQRLRAIALATLAVSLVVTAPVFAAAPTSKIESVVFTDASNGFMSGVYGSPGVGFVSRTTDGGAVWQRVMTDPDNSAVGVDALGATSAWSAAYFGNYAWRTTNGTTWAQTSGQPSALAAAIDPGDVAVTGAESALVVGQQINQPVNGDVASIWRTVNGGADWDLAFEGPLYPPDDEGTVPQTVARFEAIDAAPGGSDLFAVGWENVPDDQQAFKQALIYRSTNGGSTWTTQTPPASTQALLDVAAVSGTVAWATGNVGVIKTANGTSWTRLTTNLLTKKLRGIDALDADHAIVVGEAGQIGYTINGGTSWTFATAPSAKSYNSVAFRDATHAVAVGDDLRVALVTLNATTGAVGPVTELVADQGNYPSTRQSTTLSLTVPSTSAYQSATLTGYLIGGASGLATKPVIIERATNSAGPWTYDGTATTWTSNPGYFRYPAKPSAKTYYRARFAETDAYTASTSVADYVLPSVSLGTPSASSTQTYGKSYTTYGYIAPYHSTSNSNKVKLLAYRYESGTWVYRKSFTTAYKYYSSTKTKYSASVKLPYKGKWRIRAYHATDSTNYKTYSGYRYVTVK
jgi:photosystem II stability/assembly factor-like uncharacterized protein